MSISKFSTHDDQMSMETQETRMLLSRRSSAVQLNGHFEICEIESEMNQDESLTRTFEIVNSSALSQQLDAHLQRQDVEIPSINMHEMPSKVSSRSASPSKPKSQRQLHDDVESVKIQKNVAATSLRSRPRSPSLETNSTSCLPSGKLEHPAKQVPKLSSRQVSERITLHDNGALAIRPSLSTRQRSERQQTHWNLNSEEGSTLIRPVESMPCANNTQERSDNGESHVNTYHHHELSQSETNPAKKHSTSSALVIKSILSSPVSRFVPLDNLWTYGQRVFGRYKRTPYFYSGNLATYLGAGMFMVVFDDGTINYRVQREDIMVREMLTTSNQMLKKHGVDESKNSPCTRRKSDASSAKSNSNLTEKYAIDMKLRRKSQQMLYDDIVNHCPDALVAPEMRLLPSQHVMVDFSLTPPREVILSFDDNCVVAEVGVTSFKCSQPKTENERCVIQDEALNMTRLDCGVAYEDDSTQASDSEDSSDEDMLMTPWQQMTQTFGITKATRPQRGTGRRATMSSVSQIERISITHKGRRQQNSITPKSFWQIIVEYFLRGNRRVQPTKLTDELALAEHVRLMEAKLYTMRSDRCNATQKAGDSVRVVYERAPNGIRAYGAVTRRVENGSYAVLTEDEDSLTVEVVPQNKVELLPSVNELEQQLTDIERSQRVFFAGQKVQVSLHPETRFCGRGVITLEQESQTYFHVLLESRIRLVNVPIDKIIPVQEKKKATISITEDQFLVCNNKVKVYIGDQIYVKCMTENDDLGTTSEEEKVGHLNGVYSNNTAAVDFADGSTGYEIPPHLIYKRKRLSVPLDLDVRSLKNAVLMQASATAQSGGKRTIPVLEEGYQVKADHPRKAAVASCVVIKIHPSSACDLRFSDGTIIFEVFPSQMIIDSIENQRFQLQARFCTNESRNRTLQMPVYAIDDYVLAWSSRFGRYCSAKIRAKTFNDSISDSESEPGVDRSASSIVQSIATDSVEYTLVFDYGEQTTHVPTDKITRLDDTTALSHTQRLTNYSIDTMGFELSRVTYTIGEAVMARVHGTARYFNGIVEAVNEKERVCVVCFDSSERDIAVPFSAMFSINSKLHMGSRGSSTCTKRLNSSSSIATSRTQFLSRHRVSDDATSTLDAGLRSRRNSIGPIRNMLKSTALSMFRNSQSKRNLDPRRPSHMITEIGARFHRPHR
ncbi:hypothetical protein Plhal703r1_c12g0060701 [Plasmopara halstedii]